VHRAIVSQTVTAGEDDPDVRLDLRLAWGEKENSQAHDANLVSLDRLGRDNIRRGDPVEN
jgi:hypothetical protein